jgi:hypothetical protein
MSKLCVRVLHLILRLSIVEDTLLAFRGLRRLLWKTVADMSSTWEVWTVSLISDVYIRAAVVSLIPHSIVSSCNRPLSRSEESSTACNSVSIVLLSRSYILRTLLFTPVMTSVWIVIMGDAGGGNPITTSCNFLTSLLMLYRISNQAFGCWILKSWRAINNTLTNSS